MQAWQKRCKLTPEQVESKTVPTWANSMVENWRRLLDLFPREQWSDWEIFEAIESTEVYLFEEDDQVEIMKDALAVP